MGLTLKRQGNSLAIILSKTSPQVLLTSKQGAKANLQPNGAAELRIPLPEVEVGIPTGLPLPGASTSQLKVLNESRTAKSMTLQLEAQAGSTYDLPLRLNRGAGNATASDPRLEGGTLLPAATGSALRTVHIVFPSGEGYQQATVRLTW